MRRTGRTRPRRSARSDEDEDADTEDNEWSLGGTDKDDFEIEDGVAHLQEVAQLYEMATDSRRDVMTWVIRARRDRSIQRDGDGSRMRTETVGEQAVEVTVTNLDEPGEETFTQLQVQVGRSPDGRA